MATFVMVVSGVSAAQLEKLLGIQSKSANKVRFVPQGANAQQNPVGSQPLQEIHSQNAQQSNSSFNNVRLEWSDDGAKFAREAFDLFVKEEPKPTA